MLKINMRTEQYGKTMQNRNLCAARNLGAYSF